ncbi:MAG: hypothetical protein IJE74_01005 [Clostridia bacterium]|nr:hypothetical protein [Clostridia bacterium]
MKKVLNILAITDLSVLALWAVTLIISRIAADSASADVFAAIFVIIYIIAIVAVAAFTVASIILMVKKKKFSLPLMIFTYVVNIAWTAIFAMVIDYVTNIF